MGCAKVKKKFLTAFLFIYHNPKCLSEVDLQAGFDRYWHQRRRIFSKYDEGIWMTDDAWFGVTPEPVAKYVKKNFK